MTLRILIVDDSITIRAVLKKALTLTNLEIGEIVQVGNGIEALKVLDEQSVDFVFTDIVMPEMDGEVFIAKLHETGRTPDLPVIVISSVGDKERIERLLAMGVRGFIPKPFAPEQIEDVVVENTGVKIR